jgi:hypothetical protein
VRSIWSQTILAESAEVVVLRATGADIVDRPGITI